MRDSVYKGTLDTNPSQSAGLLLSRVICDGEDLGVYGLFKYKGAYEEAFATHLTEELRSINPSLFTFSDNATSNLQMVGGVW